MAKHESNAGLLEIEPSPIEETPAEFKGDYFGNDTSTSSQPQSTHTLGLSSHSTVYYLQRIQRYSSYVFTAFAAAHVRS